MNTFPLVSVVVPAYNAASTIDEMIASVLRQTIPDLELVICNDASTDETASRIETYEDRRIRLISNTTNMGEGATRDRAIDTARGKWIAMLDADDAWEPERLECLLNAADDDPDIMPFDNLMVCHHKPHGQMVRWRPVRPHGTFGASPGRVKDVSLAEYIRSPRLLIKPLIPRNALLRSGVRHSSRKFAADSEFFIRLGLSGLRFRYLDKPLYLYRAMPGSATAQAKPYLMRECLEDLLRLDDVPEEVAQALHFKIADLYKQEKLYMLADSLRNLDFPAIAKALIISPSLIPRALPILVRRLHYVVHRNFYGGMGR